MYNPVKVHPSSTAYAFPYVLKFTDIRFYIFVTAFVAMNIAIPWACHYISPSAGPTFLPMFFFSLLAGLLFGWRAGLLVGLITPLLSFSISGMPLLTRLPHIAIENAIFGLSAGLLRESFKLSVRWTLIGAIVLGHLALGLAVLAINWGEVSPFSQVWQVIRQGWPGIAIQLVCLPLVVKCLDGWLAGKLEQEKDVNR